MLIPYKIDVDIDGKVWGNYLIAAAIYCAYKRFRRWAGCSNSFAVDRIMKKYEDKLSQFKFD